MTVRANVRLNSAPAVALRPGDLIGRSTRAALRVNDPRISEAHALVSLRGLSLRLLALRGRFAVNGTPSVDAILAEGLVIQMASDLLLTVEEIELGGVALALESDSRGRLFLPPVASIDASTGDIAPGFRAGAGGVVWSDDDTLHLRIEGEADAVLRAGQAFSIGKHRFTVVATSLAELALEATAGDASFNAPLVLHVRYDTVHVWRGPDAFAIDGIPARILSELASMGVPAAWRTVANLIWRDEDDEIALRQKWDSGLARLRKRLRDVGLRRDLLRTDGAGLVELFLRPGDRVEDAS